MKKILAIVAVALIFASATAVKAATIVVNPVPGPGTNLQSVSLNGGAQNGQFDTVFFSATPDVGTTLINLNSGLASGAPRPAGAAFTYRNRILDLDPADPDNAGGKGWTILAPVNTASAASFTGGPLGNKITTANEPSGNLFIYNLNTSAGGHGTGFIQLINGGTLVQQIPFEFGATVPEPATVGLASLAMLGLVAVRRRK